MRFPCDRRPPASTARGPRGASGWFGQGHLTGEGGELGSGCPPNSHCSLCVQLARPGPLGNITEQPAGSQPRGHREWGPHPPPTGLGLPGSGVPVTPPPAAMHRYAWTPHPSITPKCHLRFSHNALGLAAPGPHQAPRTLALHTGVAWEQRSQPQIPHTLAPTQHGTCPTGTGAQLLGDPPWVWFPPRPPGPPAALSSLPQSETPPAKWPRAGRAASALAWGPIW